LRNVITTKNNLNNYIFGKIETGTRKQGIRQNIRIDVNRFCRDVEQVLTLSERIHKFSAWTAADAIADTVSRYLKHFTYKFYNFIGLSILRTLQNFFFIRRTIMNYLSTADIDAFICQFVHCASLLAMATSVYGKYLQQISDNAAAEASYDARGR